MRSKEQSFPTAEEERALLEIAHFAEDGKARIAAQNELVMRNYPMIFGTTKRTFRYGFTVEECISVAVEAFIYSIHKFDFRAGRLSTYAVRAIQHKVVRWAGEQSGAVRIPATLQNKKTLDRMSDDVKRAFAAARQKPLSTDYVTSDGAGDGFPSIGEELAYRDHGCEFADGPTYEQLHAAIARLRPRYAELIHGRLAGKTLREIGEEWGLTRERIRQIEKAAMRDLRWMLQQYRPNGDY